MYSLPQKSEYGVVSVGNGNTSGSNTNFKVSSQKTTLIHVGLVSAPAAGSFKLLSNATQIAPTLYFAAKGTIYVGESFECTNSDSPSANVTLDSASSGTSNFEFTYRIVSKGSTPGSSG